MKCSLVIILFIYFADVVEEILALKCTSDEGLTTEEVRKVVRKCMRKNNDDGYQKYYDEYENFESDDDENDKQRGGFEISNSRRTNDRNRQHSNNYNARQNNDQQQQGAGNYNDMMNNRNDRNGNQNPYQSNNNNNRYNDNYNSNNDQNGNNGYNNNNNHSNNRNNNHNGSDKAEKDHSCILQCFFQELKMVFLVLFLCFLRISKNYYQKDRSLLRIRRFLVLCCFYPERKLFFDPKKRKKEKN